MAQMIDERKEDVLEDYKHGATTTFLAAKYKCSRNTVVKRLTEWGVYKKGKFNGVSKWD